MNLRRSLRKNRKTIISLAWIAGAISAWTFFTFAGALQNGFIALDTRQYVVDNEHIRSFAWGNIQWMFTKAYASNWHPLTWLSHALDYALYGLDPFGHHLTSIVIHCLNVAGVFLLLVLLFQKQWQSRVHLLFGAALAALLFGVHPQRVESVVWVAERKDVLCLFFSLWTLLFYTRHVQIDSRRARWGWLGASLVAFALALLAKPMAVTLPIVLLLLDVYPLRRIIVSTKFRIQSDLRTYVRIGLEKLPFALLSLASIQLTLWAQGGDAVMSTGLVPMYVRVLNAMMAIVFYLYKFLLPINLFLNYPIFPFPGLRNGVGFLGIALLLVIISVQVIRKWRSGVAFWLVSWLIFLVTLSPVIGIVFVGHAGAADRYTYLPTIPFFAIVGFAAAAYLERVRGTYANWIRGGIVCAAVLLVGGSSWLTVQQIKVWKTDVSLWEKVAAAYPAGPSVLYPLGFAYEGEGDYYRAIDAYEKALALESEETTVKEVHQFARAGKTSVYVYIYVRLGGAYEKVRDVKNAIRVYRFVLENGFPISDFDRRTLRRRLKHLDAIAQKPFAPTNQRKRK